MWPKSDLCQADRHVFKFIGSLLPAYDLLVHDRRNTGIAYY